MNRKIQVQVGKITTEHPEIVNTDELISDFTFLFKLSKRNSILDFDLISPDFN